MPCTLSLPSPVREQLALHLLYDQLKRAQGRAGDAAGERQQDALRAALGRLKALGEATPYRTVEAELRGACPEPLLKKLKFEDRFEAQLQATAAKLAAISIFEVSATMLKTCEGVAALALAGSLGKLVLAQYQGDAVQFAANALKLRWEGYAASEDPAFADPVDPERARVEGWAQAAAAQAAAEAAAAAAEVAEEGAEEEEGAELSPEQLERQQAEEAWQLQRKQAEEAWLARPELDRQQSEARRMARRIDECVSPQATVMVLRGFRRDSEMRSEIGAVLASQPQWSNELAAQVGSYLMHRLVKVALMPDRHGDHSDSFWADGANDAYDAADGSWDAPPSAWEESGVASGREAGGAGEPAFSFVNVNENTRGRGKTLITTKYMKASEDFLRRMLPTAMSPNVLRDRLAVHPAEFPMLTPPLAWSKSEDEEDEPVGGCFHHSTRLVRTRFAPAQQQLRRTPGSQLQPLFEALDSLAATPWRVNRPMLELALKLFEERDDLSVSFLPDRTRRPQPVPSELVREVGALLKARAEEGGGYQAAREHFGWPAYTEWRRACADVKVHNANLHSQSCTARLQLDVAREHAERTFYFPYNVDFRGRVYPVSPYLSHIGDDLCRGLLLFGEARPLGKSGFRWLKIHLANLYGMDKLPLARRVDWADEAIASGIIAEVATDPLSHKAVKWWGQAESTLQAIAVATELHAAHTHRPEGAPAWSDPEPESYPSSMPVHQDGSCNGLQHYAALLRDTHGAKQARPPHTLTARRTRTPPAARAPPPVRDGAVSTVPCAWCSRPRAMCATCGGHGAGGWCSGRVSPAPPACLERHVGM